MFLVKSTEVLSVVEGAGFKVLLLWVSIHRLIFSERIQWSQARTQKGGGYVTEVDGKGKRTDSPTLGVVGGPGPCKSSVISAQINY